MRCLFPKHASNNAVVGFVPMVGDYAANNLNHFLSELSYASFVHPVLGKPY